MSTILTISPDLVHDLLVVAASATVGAVAALWRVQAQRQANYEDKALITSFLGGNDAWEREHKARFALEAKPIEAEVLHVEHATGELPTIAEGLARLADEVGLVQALSDRPAEDEPCDGCGKPWRECAESDDDEVGDEQAGEAWFDGLVRAWRRLADWWSGLWASRRERHMVGSGEQATDRDPFAELLAHVEDSATTDAEEREVLDEAWRAAVAARAESSPRHASDELAQDTGYRGSRWAAGIEHTGLHPIVVPAQRSGDTDA